jgi:hypothetical protein
VSVIHGVVFVVNFHVFLGGVVAVVVVKGRLDGGGGAGRWAGGGSVWSGCVGGFGLRGVTDRRDGLVVLEVNGGAGGDVEVSACTVTLVDCGAVTGFLVAVWGTEEAFACFDGFVRRRGRHGRGW